MNDQYHIDIQQACEMPLPVTDEMITQWAELALSSQTKAAELTIRLVDVDEITHLNFHYRKQNKPTNVLAFSSSLPAGVTLEYPLLGDVIICPAVVAQESVDLHKSIEAHWALMVIHGTLHLLGLDHIQDDDAVVMQALEVELLAKAGFDNPYMT